MDGTNMASFGVASDELRAFIERIERIDGKIDDLKQDRKEIFEDAKARGFMTRPLRQIVAMRKKSADDLAEEQAVLEMYKAALGMS